MSEEIPDSGSSVPLRRSRARSIVLGVALGSLAALLGLLVILALTLRGGNPVLTEAALDAAERLWRDRGPASYDLDLVLSGRQTGNLHVEVRHGEVTKLLRDGRAPSQRRTWDYWSVPSQFDVLRRELAAAAEPQNMGAPTSAQVVQRAQFDPHFGYPLEYERVVYGAPLEIRWKVTRFAVVP